MEKLRKITVRVPKQLLEKTLAHTGEGVTQTVRIALERFVSDRAHREALKPRG